MKARKVFIDTSAFIALRDSKDINHKKAKSALSYIREKNIKLVTTNFILDEVYTYFCKFHSVAVEMGEYILNSPEIIEYHRITSEDENTAWEIAKKYSDKSFSFTDCTSFSICKKLKVEDIFAFDIHFEQFGKFKMLGMT
ncbi:MAG: type II toxin-antitoxin system VapC family toxin [Thermodesulfobacteriota bacterium]